MRTGKLIVAAALVVAAAQPAVAAAHAPQAPAGLSVNDRESHLNVEGAPQFGWLPRDRDPDEVQTAYRITVRRAGSWEVVWDSGKVGTSQQSYVRYEGPDLEPGAAYAWSVRTWDRSGKVSPPAVGRFETGLGDGDWEGAQWIRRASTEADDYTLARTELDVTASPVVRARAYTAAVHTYELFLNGVRADRGNSFGYAGENYYQAADVTELVRAGRPLAIGVHYHWYGSGQGRPAGERGLLMKLVIEHADGTRQVVVTDGSWRVMQNTAFVPAERRNGEGDRIETQDARGAIAGWTQPGYDDSAAPWTAPEVVGAHPAGVWTRLIGQETRRTETELAPVALRTADDGTVVADFGKVIPAHPVVRFDAGVAGRTIPIRAGYRLLDSGRVDTSTLLTQGTDMSFPYTQADGEQEFRAFTHLGFRYLEIPGAGEDISIDDVSAVVVHTDTPAGRQALFSSSDATLNAVWDLLQRSAIYSVQEAFVDTPTREKGQFLGDAADISYATMAAFAERDATQQAIHEFLRSADRFWNAGNDLGRYNAVYPNGDGKRDIPDYSLMLVDWVWRYYIETGDRALVEQAYAYLRNTADYVLRHIPADGPTAGLVTNLAGGSGPYLFGIVDWPEPGRFGYDMSAAARTTINAQGVDVLRTTARIAQLIGRPGAEIEHYADSADELAQAINERLRRADGVYVDGLLPTGEQSAHAGQHSTSYSIAHRVAPAEDWDALAEQLAGMGMKQGPMTAHRLLQALSDAGRADAVLDLLTDEDDLGWANILAQDGTFTWEAWTLDPGTNFSESHGWGSQAAVDVLGTMLGVRIAGPGARSVEIVPPDTELRHAAGTVHTQRGPVKLAWRRHGHGVSVRLELPVNVRARVALPLGGRRGYRAGGPSKARFVGVEDGRAVFEVGSGRSFFTPTGR